MKPELTPGRQPRRRAAGRTPVTGRAISRRPGSARPKPKIKVWVVFGSRTKFGDGRAQLLRLIDELGSIKKAVTRLSMSYRNAWGYLEELENAAGFRLLERQSGGGEAGGTRLTPRGRTFLKRYWRFRKAVERDAQRRFAVSFGRKREAARALPASLA